MKPATAAECIAAQTKALRGFDAALKQILESRAEKPFAPLYKMLQYFHGFLDEDFKPQETDGGKRFRPALCILIAESLGAGNKVMNAALAIELYHNFTLIHDDIEDQDEERRNRPTLWKLVGLNHAINAGDMLSLIASAICVQLGREIGGTLLSAFADVIEGQFLDFELAEAALSNDIVNEKSYFLMIQKKTASLVSASAEVAGQAAGESQTAQEKLREYGMALGTAFQLYDDYVSIWSMQEKTGKDTHSDIREHKRTLPFLVAYKELTGDRKKKLAELYTLRRQINEKEIEAALQLIDETSAKERMQQEIKRYAGEAKRLTAELSVPDETKAILSGLVDMLVPQA